MKDTLIIQFKTAGGVDDFDWLIKVEDALIQAFSQNGKATVDGHDFGNGDMNIFIFPKRGWSAAIDIVIAHLRRLGALDRAVIIKRSKTERYTVAWPEQFTGAFVKL
jgi:hypothetical protein